MNRSEAHLGHEVTEETRRKIALRMKSNTNPVGHVLTLDSRLLIGESNRISNNSPDVKERLRLFNLGRTLPLDVRERMSGSNSVHWLGGISFEPYSTQFNEILKEQIRLRDNYTCRICLAYGNHVHHVDYDKENCAPWNLITLCRSDNSKVNFNRWYWMQFLTKLLEEIYGGNT